ncbi:toll/interleukin-1 receptor domain-containing protein [Catellatospora vulcania]|uniref:toll/interleukin-1 receptor domain-containing protein n=1 Tax=Catellatospora vulcania TaxID=1460450 RepID=UPI0012D3A62C|nr:toll/interleukin-1 receptor domain-containing protein [Catellatospora vulcania]
MSGPVFISFSRERDAAYAQRLAAHLIAAGLPTVYDTQPMSDGWWSTYTRAQLDGCSAVIAVMTPAAEHDGWVARELDHARRLGRPVLAVLAAGTPWLEATECDDVTGGGPPGADLLRRLHVAAGIVAPPAASVGSGHTVPLRGGAIASAVGIEVRGGVFVPLLDAGTRVPCTRTEWFTTADDGQPAIQVHVFHGTGTAVAEARSLGSYELVLDRAPAGVPQIGVTFQVDELGEFRLTAAHADGREVTVRPPSPKQPA